MAQCIGLWLTLSQLSHCRHEVKAKKKRKGDRTQQECWCTHHNTPPFVGLSLDSVSTCPISHIQLLQRCPFPTILHWVSLYRMTIEDLCIWNWFCQTHSRIPFQFALNSFYWPSCTRLLSSTSWLLIRNSWKRPGLRHSRHFCVIEHEDFFQMCYTYQFSLISSRPPIVPVTYHLTGGCDFTRIVVLSAHPFRREHCRFSRPAALLLAPPQRVILLSRHGICQGIHRIYSRNQLIWW